MAPTLTDDQSRHIMLVERVASSFSILGSLWIILSFLSGSAFREKPIAKLIFMASFGNTMVNVATFISRDGMVGGDTGLCRTQAFLIQWLLPSDLLWSLACSCNVFLAFVCRYKPQEIRKLEWLYCVGCYGVPLIPSIVYFFIRSASGVPVYGPAEIWCWITFEWRVLRVAALYGPIWIVVVIIFAIYVTVFKKVLEVRRELDRLKTTQPGYHPTGSSFLTKARDIQTRIVQTVQLRVARGHAGPLDQAENRRISVVSVFSLDHAPLGSEEELGLYTVTAQGPGNAARRRTERTEKQERLRERNPAMHHRSISMSYALRAGVLCLGIIFTWLPSSIFRIYALVDPDSVLYPLQVASSLFLPLQGFWNSVVYTSATRDPTKALLRQLLNKLLRRKTPAAGPSSRHALAPFPAPVSRLSPHVARPGPARPPRPESIPLDLLAFMADPPAGYDPTHRVPSRQSPTTASYLSLTPAEPSSPARPPSLMNSIQWTIHANDESRRSLNTLSSPGPAGVQRAAMANTASAAASAALPSRPPVAHVRSATFGTADPFHAT